MKQLYIKDLKKGDTIFNESFAIKKYSKSATRAGKPYLDLELADKTGTAKAKIWSDDIKNCQEVSTSDIVSIDANVEDYNGAIQIKISKLQLLKDVDEENYIEASKQDVTEMFMEIEKTIEEIKDKNIKALLRLIFEDKEFKDNYKKSSAAYKVHHAYAGGLVEHVTEVLSISKALLQRFPRANSDLVSAGVLLHDLGKVFEYSVDTTITVSKQGKLLGHIFMGTEFVKNKAKELGNFPENLLEEILHIILSHHGEIEYGSPVKPMTVEAIIVWVSDDASAKVNMAYNSIHNGNTEEFTEYHRQLGTELYRSTYYNDPEKETLF